MDARGYSAKQSIFLIVYSVATLYIYGFLLQHSYGWLDTGRSGRCRFKVIGTKSMRNLPTHQIYVLAVLLAILFGLPVFAEEPSADSLEQGLLPSCIFERAEGVEHTVPAERAVAACHGVSALTGEIAVNFYLDDRIVSLLAELLTEETEESLHKVNVVDKSAVMPTANCQFPSDPQWRLQFNQADLSKASAACSAIRVLTGQSRSRFYSDVRLLIAFTDALFY